MSISIENQNIKDELLLSKINNTSTGFIPLTITRNDLKKDSRCYIECVCCCGEIFTVRSDQTKTKKGCRKCSYAAAGLAVIKPDYASAKLIFYHSYKKNAEARDLPFELSLIEFNSLTCLNCYYCNVAPRDANYLSKTARKYGGFKTNGVDRLDNDLGYTIDNSVPCCTTCNMMKKTLKEDDFLDKIKQIYNHKIKQDECNSNSWGFGNW